MTTSFRDHLLSEHARFEEDLERLLAALELAGEDVSSGWHAFAERLRSHLAAEEKHLFPALRRVSDTSARVLLQEHRHLRTRLAEIGDQIAAQTAQLGVARAFIDELRAHAQSEDRMLYQWAEGAFDEAEHATLLAALTSLKGGP